MPIEQCTEIDGRFQVYATLNDRIRTMCRSFAAELEEEFRGKMIKVFLSDMRGHDSGEEAEFPSHKFIVEPGWEDDILVTAVDEEGNQYILNSSYVVFARPLLEGE